MKIINITLLLATTFAFGQSINHSTPQAIEASKAHAERVESAQMQQEEDTCMVSTFQGPEKGSKITAVIQEQRDSKNHLAEKQFMDQLMKRTGSEGLNFSTRVNCK